ncbi:hypothetical protein GGTG_13332 [Gaeumannomyces tritici R3-111a-1]|uniref:Amino acid permease/ SLC12A domain-containing protein n=1 Tax=Gaeumannomyces tritici (strain R3-111a-1) TaxID=644352 RepID=J3PIK3_GAET3|nr:hypothetical protein GGTG_13332 [Gaeumannomyces tritici R3-111a-1]EJT69064.1 hypothetical protein GGTG_13332 [Gaeumannomyces tritici R3-111a-1]
MPRYWTSSNALFSSSAPQGNLSAANPESLSANAVMVSFTRGLIISAPPRSIDSAVDQQSRHCRLGDEPFVTASAFIDYRLHCRGACGRLHGANLCVAEMCAYLPICGSIFELASRFVDPALGFAMGWTYFFAGLMLVCTEYSAIATVIRYWDSSTNPAAWIAVAMFSCIIANVVAVKWYGEAEFIMASTKKKAVDRLNALCMYPGGNIVGGEKGGPVLRIPERRRRRGKAPLRGKQLLQSALVHPRMDAPRAYRVGSGANPGAMQLSDSCEKTGVH